MKKTFIAALALLSVFAIGCRTNQTVPSPSPSIMPETSMMPEETMTPGEEILPENSASILDDGDMNGTGTVEPGAGTTSGGDKANATAKNVVDVARQQTGVKEVAAVVTEDQKCLVALEMEEGTTIDDNTKNAIMEAANGLDTRITTDATHYAQVKTLETTSNGAAVAGNKIQEIWDAIVR